MYKFANAPAGSILAEHRNTKSVYVAGIDEKVTDAADEARTWLEMSIYVDAIYAAFIP